MSNFNPNDLDEFLDEDEINNRYDGYETDNVNYYLNNDKHLYRSAVDFMEGRYGDKPHKPYDGYEPYKDFIKYMKLENEATEEGVYWLDLALNYDELDDVMTELDDYDIE